jgi:hypothetical protein
VLDDIHGSLLIPGTGIQILRVLPSVMGNQRTCYLDDTLGASPTVDESLIVRILMSRWILYDSFWIRMPEALDGLVFVSDDGHVRIACKQIN